MVNVQLDKENQQITQSLQLLRSFSDVQKNMMRFVQKSAAENGLSVTQYSILMTIIVHKEMTQKILGEKTFLAKSTLSQAVDGMVRDGWINRQQVEGNRREVLLSLSGNGEELIKKIRQQEGGIHQIFQAVAESLTDKQFEELLGTHQQITTYLEALDQGECSK